MDGLVQASMAKNIHIQLSFNGSRKKNVRERHFDFHGVISFGPLTFLKNPSVTLARNRTCDLPITSSDTDSRKIGKIRVLASRSRTCDLPITSSDTDSRKIGKTQMLSLIIRTCDMQITTSDIDSWNIGIRVLPTRSRTFDLPINGSVTLQLS